MKRVEKKKVGWFWWMAAAAISFPILGCSTDRSSEPSSDGESCTGKCDSVTPTPFQKNKLTFPDDSFAAVGGLGQSRWVKFTILVSNPTKVYFQDSNKYPFHFDFAKKHITGFANMTAQEFAGVTLKAEGQRLITGTVLLPPRNETLEYGIQFIREDPHTKEEVKALFDRVKQDVTVASGQTVRVFYMPTYEQRTAAERDKLWLAQNDVPIGSPDRWLLGDGCYALGWSFGKVKFFAGSDIKQAYLDGRLTALDILLTDGVPAEVPFVAGIVTLSPSTPNSHVAILSQTWGIPFVYPADEAQRTRLKALEGREIALRTTSFGDGMGNRSCSLDVIEPGPIDAETRAELVALRTPQPVEVAAKTRAGVLTKGAVQLTPADVKHFGGKASNFGTLRRTLPRNSPNALGVSFDLWDAFLSQVLPTNKTLKQEIDARLGGLAFPPDIRQLETRLAEIRRLVTDTATLPAAPRTQLFAELRAFGFNPREKLRFRSSTNVEDGAVLSGAGLYDSYSGCLQDDLDAGTNGPSACDPNKPKPRGAERAIKKVYASFFNTNAVLERLKYRIPEDKVGMALVVHRSFPDETEAANGVATVRLDSYWTTVNLVTQLGAESVTNPTGTTVPEAVSAQVFDSDMVLTFNRGSSLVPLGGKVLEWEEDYKKFVTLMVTASKGFIADHGITDAVTLDIEFKKTTDGSLILKQIRQVPARSINPSVVPVLLSEPVQFCTAQDEFGTALANHRLKMRLALVTRNTKLSNQDIARSLVESCEIDMVENGVVVQKTGSPTSFPGALHAADGEGVRDSWSWPVGKLTLETNPNRLVSPADVPIFVARDFLWSMAVQYPEPRPEVDFDGVTEVDGEQVVFERCASDNDVGQPRTVEAAAGGVQVKTQFYYRKARSPFEKTSALARWERTEIRGLVSQPIVLKGWFSQSFRPGHHNFNEDFVFEPGLEEGLPSAVLQELAQKDIQLVVLQSDSNSTLYILRKSTQKLERL